MNFIFKVTDSIDNINTYFCGETNKESIDTYFVSYIHVFFDSTYTRKQLATSSSNPRLKVFMPKFHNSRELKLFAYYIIKLYYFLHVNIKI